ncbi:MAG: hypothetical protein PHR38_06745 [Bacteroidales bacterium]|nr:hypothetical protein [Bacteroidales bacterium]MDD3908278.1 hypothetical protein [Bacteroidales bacterium]MDD4712852.1 hypothetical protein [Bacteroidales bacterium]
MADVDFDGQVQWTRRVRQNKILKVRRNEIFVPEPSEHKLGLAETEVMPMPEESDAKLPAKKVLPITCLKQTILNLQLIPANHKKDHTFIITSQLFNLISYPI